MTDYYESVSDSAGNMTTYFTGATGIISLIIGVIFYVLMGLGLYKMAQNAGNEHAWFAWVPFLNLYLIGELTGNEMWGMRNSKWILVLAPFVIGFLGMIPFIGWMIAGIGGIVYQIYYWCILYKLYKIYQPNRAVLYIVLSIIFSAIAIPIIFFLMRKNRPQRIY